MGIDMERGSADHDAQRLVWVEPEVVSLDAAGAEENGAANGDSAFGLS